MRRIRTLASRARSALAGLIAVASLMQMPAMVFAATGVATESSDLAAHINHHHHGLHPTHDNDTESTAGFAPAASTCQLAGCCIGIGTACVAAPTASERLLGTLQAALARVMVPTPADPTDPPPRLRV